MCKKNNSKDPHGDKRNDSSQNPTHKDDDTSAPDPHVCPLNRKCRAQCLAWRTGSLPLALRWFAEYHDWHESGHLANQLKILLVFKKPVRATANKLLAVGLDGLAGQIKKELKRLLEMCQPLDGLRGRLIVEEDEAIKMEHTRGYLTESLVELADLVEIGQKAGLSGQQKLRETTDATDRPEKKQPSSRKIVDIPPDGDGQWITVTAAAKLLNKSPGTISNWATIGKVRDNGKKYHQRRILKADVLLIKQEIEDNDAKKDADDEWQDKKIMDRQL